MIDRHSPPLIRVIRAHERIPSGRIVRLSAPPFADLPRGMGSPACAFLEVSENGRMRLGREKLRGGYLRALPILMESALLAIPRILVSVPASVTRLGHENVRARSRRIAILREWSQNGSGHDGKGRFYFIPVKIRQILLYTLVPKIICERTTRTRQFILLCCSILYLYSNFNGKLILLREFFTVFLSVVLFQRKSEKECFENVSQRCVLDSRRDDRERNSRRKGARWRENEREGETEMRECRRERGKKTGDPVKRLRCNA